MAKYFVFCGVKYPVYPVGGRFVTLLPSPQIPSSGIDRPYLVLLNADGTMAEKGGLMMVPKSWAVVENGDVSSKAFGELVDE